MESSGERFADGFYRALFERYPELQEYFSGVNLLHQAAMLTMALQIVVQHDCRSTRSTKDYLGVLGYKHHQRGISKDDYDKFKAALLASLSGFHGASWHQSLEQEWSTAYDHAIETMLEGCAKE